MTNPADPGHIFLNGRWYMIEWPQYQRSPANPFAAKLGNGAGTYDDLEDWSTWLTDDWSTGLSRLADDGILWGDGETRFRNKLMLGPRLRLSGFHSPGLEQSKYNMPGVIAGEYAVGTTQPQSSLVIRTGPWQGSGASTPAWVMMRAAPGTEVTIKLYENFQGVVSATETVTINDEGYGYYFHYVDFDTTSLTSVDYLSVQPTTAGETVYIPYSATGTNNCGLMYSANSGVWTSTGTYGFYIVIDESPPWSVNGSAAEVILNRFPNSQASWSSGLVVSTEDLQYGIGEISHTWAGNKIWTTATPTSAVVWNSKLYTAYGSGTDIDTWDGTNSGGKTVLTGIKGDLLLSYRGYLYRALGNLLYYTANGTTWSGPFTIGPDDYGITGMAGLGGENDLYCATSEGLYKFAVGDLVYGVFPFGSADVINGRGMTNYNGDLYIPHTHGVIRMTATGSVAEVWLSEEEDLPALRAGHVKDLLRVNSFMFALVEAGTSSGMPTVLAYDGQGWHHIATLPRSLSPSRLFYDRQSNLLWITTQEGLIFYLYIPNQSLNPLRDSSYQYAPFAWIETDWYDGGLKEIVKDYESVYIAGEGMGNGLATVYWKDAESTDWEELGTFSSDSAEIVWEDFGKRPQTRKIKLAFFIRTASQAATPVITAVRVKYHNMVNDRWRWQIVLRLEDGQQMFDGSINNYNADSMRRHVNAAVTQTLPVRFIDVDGRAYNVKVQQAMENIEKLERINESVRYDSKFTLTLAEV